MTRETQARLDRQLANCHAVVARAVRRELRRQQARCASTALRRAAIAQQAGDADER